MARKFLISICIMVILTMTLGLPRTVAAQEPEFAPIIYGLPFDNFIFTVGWNNGDILSAEVYESKVLFETGAAPLLHLEAEFADFAGFPTTIYPDLVDLRAGNYIRVSNGVVTRDLVISNLAMTGQDFDHKTISGTFDPALNNLLLYAEGQPATYVDISGETWTAYFDTLSPLYTMEMGQLDDDGDMTYIAIWLPIPMFDLYTLNMKTGEVEQVTSLAGAGEWNASWSPDGKKLVHDVAADGGLDRLYITDIATHTSTLLEGSWGANDAVWSPNGQWILFDHRGSYDYSLYVLPPEGGTQRKVVENALNGSWSPNSKYVAFERDGGIWTASVAGGQAVQVSSMGYNPVWSPNGQWIAYDLSYDLWKVRVDPTGKPLGEPIQLTSGDISEIAPTWSADGQKIAFTGNFNGDDDLWIMPATGGEVTLLVGTDEFFDCDSSISHNGQYLVFSKVTVEQ